jgi:serine/threonine protein kinase
MIVTGTVLAMRFLHSRGIIHGNVRPATIFIGEKARVQIGGVLRSGAPRHYQSAEGPGSEKADVFSFGLCFYEIMARKPVFAPDLPERNVDSRLHKSQLGVVPDAWPQLSREILAKTLHKDPAKRPTFHEILTLLANKDFQVQPDVDAQAVRSYIKEVEPPAEPEQPTR